MKYVIRKEATGINFDVQYILENENGAVLLTINGNCLREMYNFYTKNKQQAKDVLNSTLFDPYVSKEAIDFFVEETYEK